MCIHTVIRYLAYLYVTLIYRLVIWLAISLGFTWPEFCGSGSRAGPKRLSKSSQCERNKDLRGGFQIRDMQAVFGAGTSSSPSAAPSSRCKPEKRDAFADTSRDIMSSEVQVLVVQLAAQLSLPQLVLERIQKLPHRQTCPRLGLRMGTVLHWEHLVCQVRLQVPWMLH